MGLTQVPAVAGLSRNVQAFTSSTTWTVPSTAIYVDVLVVGAGGGGQGGKREASNGGFGGGGGAIVVAKNIYLGGTGTVTITIGSGTNGSTGTATTTDAAQPGQAGFSSFGDIIIAGGGYNSAGGVPGYKGNMLSYGWGVPNSDPSINDNTRGIYYVTYGGQGFRQTNSTGIFGGFGLDAIGLKGGASGYGGTSNLGNLAGTIPGGGGAENGNGYRLTTVPTLNWFNVNSYLGAATAGTVAGAGGTAGPGGVTGLAGGGGTPYYGTGQHGQGGPGAGGAGGQGGLQLGGSGNGGNGGNAGANTGAGGGAGGSTGGTGGGTGGNGGNGAAGIIVVSWLG